jgi:tartrate-resistant acid phosphatase type 5
MKRRDFVKKTALTALGASLIGPVEGLAATRVTHFESDDLSSSAIADENFPLNFLAIGDWGRNGEYKQLEVGKQMGLWAAAHPNNFIISVGDNFYPRGVVSETDPLWHFSFENVYTAHSLQNDWYPIFGNHDYGSDPDAQIRYSKISRRWNMPSRYYAKEMKIGKGKETALFVFIDTQPIIYDLKEQEPEKQLAWINETLKSASPEVKWKIVVGHHPSYTVGPRIKNYDTLAIRKALSGLFEKHKVNVYLSGHDHSLQHLKAEEFTHQFISGAGSELTEVTAGIPYSRFEASEHGFMYFSINGSQLKVKAINDAGKVLYETTISNNK